MKSGTSSNESMASFTHCAIFHEGSFELAGYTGRNFPAKSATAESTSLPSGTIS